MIVGSLLIVGWIVAAWLVAPGIGAAFRHADRGQGAGRRAAPDQIPDGELPPTYRP